MRNNDNEICLFFPKKQNKKKQPFKLFLMLKMIEKMPGYGYM